jgi:very-short-patch-repair endonuclease
MDARLAPLLAAQRGLLACRQARAAGLSEHELRRLLESGRLVTVVRGVYAEAGVRLDLSRRSLAVQLRYGPSVTISCRTAAMLWGWPVLAAPEDLEVVALPGHLNRPPRGLVVRHARLRPEERVWTTAGYLTSHLRTLLDVLRTCPLVVAVVTADRACRADPGLLESVREAALSRRDLRGLAAARRALAHVEPLAESVLESLLRLVLVLGGLPRPLAQVGVDLDGQRLRGDLVYDRARLWLEADGRADHETWSATSADRRRQNLLVNAGWRVLRFTWADVVGNPNRVLASVARALGVPWTPVTVPLW